ncbi:MAG: hypothetical protein FWC70_10235 [Defluviitaleaceae bacterium]|nr:hypothetical protein [Defluviitaleaceae bacterium]
MRDGEKRLFYCTLCGKKLADSDACTRCGNDSSDKIQKRKGYFFEETVKPCAKYVVTQYQKQKIIYIVLLVIFVLCVTVMVVAFIRINRDADVRINVQLPFGIGWEGEAVQLP